MSERVSVYLLPLRPQAVPPRASDSAKAMVADAAGSAEPSGLRTDVSSDGWHPELTLALCRACSIEGLGFLSSERRVLTPDEAAVAASAVEQLLSRLEARSIPGVERSFWPQWEVIREADLAEAIAEAIPCSDIDEEDGEVQTFVEFLVAVQLAATEAQALGTGLLYFRPLANRQAAGDAK